MAHLAPQEHAAKHDLQPVEEVVSDDNDGGASRGPALPGADGLDAGGSSWEVGEDPGQGAAPRWRLRLAKAGPGVLTFRRIQAPGPAAMFGVVVHKHVVRHGQHVSVHTHSRGHHHLYGQRRQSGWGPVREN